jgi:YbgC/YbaW family acyl-CoA thioester hydrolase
MTSEHRLKRRVLFHETDLAGVVHFSNFFKYMEEAEHAMWREAGISIAPQGEEIGWPRVAVSCDYRQPLRFEDEFEVWVRVVAMTARSIRYACSVTRGPVEVAEGAMTIVCVHQGANGTMTPRPIPPDVAARFEVYRGAGE